ncbi:MAG: DUF481 domain-containing protein [Desulfamplus sp.]|nr:DUF481 domain-containing protein [Desulfamplus sp.]MBF0389748.1 DUF481 domain-containing protein [Desulfamplus sp.]
MNYRLLRAVIVFIAMLFIAYPLSTTIAQEKKSSEQEKKTEDGKKQDLVNWWTRNPLTFDPMPEDLLWHFEANYQYDRGTGNWTTDNHLLDSLLSLRYHRFTNNLRYNFDKRNVAKPTPPPNSEKNTSLRKSTKHEIHEDFRYAITKRMYAAPGIMYLEDDYSYIDERYTYYAGIGGDLYSFKFSNMEVFKLSMFGAYGYETKRYIDDYHETYAIVKDWGIADNIKNYDPGTEEGDLFYLNQRILLFPYYGIMVTQEFDYFVDTGDSDKYRWTFSVGLDFKVMEHLFVSLSYKEDYDNNANQLLGIRKRDQTQGIGIKVVF